MLYMQVTSASVYTVGPGLPPFAWLQWHCCTAQSLFLFILDKLIKLCHPKGMGLDRKREMDHERLFSFLQNWICCTFRYDSRCAAVWPYSLKITGSNKKGLFRARVPLRCLNNLQDLNHFNSSGARLDWVMLNVLKSNCISAMIDL